MGDIGVGGPLLSPAESISRAVTKSSALHVEDSHALVDDKAMEPTQRSGSQDMIAETGATPKPIDTPMHNSTSSTHSAAQAEPGATSSDQSSTEASDQPKTVDFVTRAAETPRPASTDSTTSSNFKPPTPLRLYRDTPKLWVTDGPEAGKESAVWRLRFEPFIHDHVKDMTTEQRTKEFDRLVKLDEDKYLQALATYYTMHTDEVPERGELDPKTKKNWEEILDESPRIAMRQQSTFRDWNWNTRTKAIDQYVGPRNEKSPDDEPALCDHCIREALKHKILRKFSAPIRIVQKKLGRRASEAQVQKPDLVVTVTETGVDDSSQEDLRKSGDQSSSCGKSREDLTETGFGRSKALPQQRRVATGLSTVQTR